MSDIEAGGSSESTSRLSKRKDPPESDQNFVNRAILESLQRLQESIDYRDSLRYEDEDTYDPEDSLEDYASYVDVESDIAHLTGTGDASSSRTDGEADVLLEYDSHLDIESDTKGPKISEKVAAVVNKLCLKRISQEQSKILMKRHNTTENFKVRLPKCERSIWNQIEGHIRVNDVKLQGTQSLLLSSIYCQLKVSKRC